MHLRFIPQWEGDFNMASPSSLVGAVLVASSLTVCGCTAGTPPSQTARVVLDPAQIQGCTLKGILPPESTADPRHDELGVPSQHLQAQLRQLGGNVILMRAPPGGGTGGGRSLEVYACPPQ